MTSDQLFADLAESGWKLRYLTQEHQGYWAAVLYQGRLSTPRVTGDTASEALANALEATQLAEEFVPDPYALAPKLSLASILGPYQPANASQPAGTFKRSFGP